MKNKQNNIEHNGVKAINNSIVLSKEQFKEFTTFLNIIKLHFKDFCIVNGHFRSRSNDNTIIVETGFRYFRNIDFNIIDTKLLVKMLSTLDKKANITITIDDINVTFTDGYQSLKVVKTNYEIIDNKFVTEETMKEIISELDADKLFIKETIPKSVVENINRIVRDLNANYITVKHTETDLNKGYIFITNQTGYSNSSNANRREYIIKLRKDFLTPMEKNHYCNASALPFLFKKADINFNWYISKDGSLIFTIYNTRVDELLIHIMGRASLIEEMEE